MSSPSAKTTIYTLSDELGVSAATVSRALANSPEISAELRRKIRRLARERDFRPGVVTRRIPTICALVQQYTDTPLTLYPYLATVVGGVAQYAHEENLEMNLHIAHVDELNRRDLVREFARRQIDGVVALSSSTRSQFFASLDEQDFPYCCLLVDDGRHPHKLLTIDNEKAGYDATRYLLTVGHRRIAVLTTPVHVQTGQQRLAGYRRALREAGVPVDETLARVNEDKHFGLEFARDAVSDLLRRNPDVTALLVMSHNLAIAALHALYRWGLRVPDQLSLLSFDDFPETAFLCPPLTVVRVPNRELAYQAARRVHRLIRGLSDSDTNGAIYLEGELIVRESVGPPRKGKLR
ncbi:MAG: LacI family DNA-binding transcriptional regulator [Candidatus Sumerlaeota bacterium]|nr:LacI family DNA-binding transcriptional regulator [Candidatus Sumerlaeota bacterium]